MRKMPGSLAMGIMLVVASLLIQGCAAQSRSGTIQSRSRTGETQTERIVDPAIKSIPPEDFEMTSSRLQSMKAELAARNGTGLPNGALMDVLFDFDRASLRSDALSVLEAYAKRLQEEGITRLLLEGRGDDVGSEAYNLMLGEHRAKNVKAYLQDLGLSIEITAISYGKDRPLCFQNTVDCYQKNRSVHFVVKK